jgi:tetratricopeptide (TPR) repeat protein
VGHLDHAARLAARAAVVYSGLAEVILAARCAVQLGCIHYQEGEYRAGVQAFERALRHLDRNEDARLVLCARHSETVCLVELGELVVAGQHFEEDQPLYAAFPDAWTRLRRDWVAGRLLAQTQPDEAVKLLELTRRGFLVEHSFYDSVLVSLDLGQVLLRLGRLAELDTLAGELQEMLRVEAATLAPETLAILRTVLATIASGSATMRILADTAALLRRQGRERAVVNSATH